jgi:hypothetical protein
MPSIEEVRQGGKLGIRGSPAADAPFVEDASKFASSWKIFPPQLD